MRQPSPWTPLVVAAAISIALVGGLVGAVYLLRQPGGAPPEVILTPVILVAMVILILVLGALAVVMRRLGLDDKRSALGLPDGSIRAILALLLLLLFLILSLYLFSQLLGQGNGAHQLNGLSAGVADSIPVQQQISRARSGGTDAAPLYDVVVRSAVDDSTQQFAMQLMTTMATLVVAVASFYFGSSAVNAARGAQKQDKAPLLAAMLVSPTKNATDVGVSAPITARFSEALDPTTVAKETFLLTDPQGAEVDAKISYDRVSRSMTLQPSQPLTPQTAYTAVIKGGSAGVKDIAGNALVADVTWTFTTA
jgi:Bacterial Ig-like domain